MRDLEILKLMLEEQRKTNELLVMLIAGMDDTEDEDPDGEPVTYTYMDGTPYGPVS